MGLGPVCLVHSALWTLLACFLFLHYGGTWAQRTGGSQEKRAGTFQRHGESLFKYSNHITKYQELQDSFSKMGTGIDDINIESLFSEIAGKVNESLQQRVDAIKKTVVDAEPMAMGYYSSDRPPDRKPKSYYSAKRIVPPSPEPPPETKDQSGEAAPAEEEEELDEEEEKKKWKFPVEMLLSRNQHFKTEVNMTYSSVHVPTSVYELDPYLLDALVWSSDLDGRFESNYKTNPTLGWQYFGSSTGFLRQYPAIKWPRDNKKKNDPDLYDCRVRPWYTASATSPKNLLILQDVSGSMTGMRRKIAAAVVSTILDTLTENDYVNVFNFSEETTALVPCFNETGTPTLVQANLYNVQEFKVALRQRQTQGMADFDEALNKAYDTLRDQRAESESADCNQAIMLISDGAPYYFQDLFNKRNPDKRIRLFTYLVGREVTDYTEIQWMACYNQGYFVHVSTLGEVQEQVLKYIDVMARPLVMSKEHHLMDVMWTPVYADMDEVVESEWRWTEMLREQQKVRSDRYKWFYQNVVENNKRKGANKTGVSAFSDGGKPGSKPDELKLALHKVKSFLDYEKTNISQSKIRSMLAEKERQVRVNKHIYSRFEVRKRFVVSASYPVFDTRNFSNSSGKEERIANFLGVVGTDVSIDELKQLTLPHRLGVNAYAFAITNNGHIVFHPDFRPLYKDAILKASYNALDLMDVELIHEDGLYRNNNSELLQMRMDMLDKEDHLPSPPRLLTVRLHRDKFRRVAVRTSAYTFGKIPNTLYTLGLQVPVNSTRFQGEIELSLLWRDRKINAVAGYFDLPNPQADNTYPSREHSRKWRIHPDWTYCHYITGNQLNYTDNKEDMLVHFMNKIQASTTDPNQTWAWGNQWGWGGKAGDVYVCDRELVQSVVFDAMATKAFTSSQGILSEARNQEMLKRTKAEFLGRGTMMTFLATRSGLTRWIDHPASRGNPSDIPFPEYHPRAIDESWYQRAVERAANEESYVYSVDFDAGTRNYSRVTATRAVMAIKNSKRAPVAVVGIQYDLDEFLNHFGLGPGSQSSEPDSKNKCENDEVECFLLDENAFIIGSSRSREDGGRSFGEVEGVLMRVLLNSSIYNQIDVTDFQAICPQPLSHSSFANPLNTPIMQLTWLFNWFCGNVLSFLLSLNFHSLINADYAPMQAEEPDEYNDDDSGDGVRNMPFIEKAYVSKTRLRPCDVEYNLYTYGTGYNFGSNLTLERQSVFLCNEECDEYLEVQRIPHTNLIMVFVEAKCKCDRRRLAPIWVKTTVRYPTYVDPFNRTTDNPILQEVCRIPQHPLYRKRLNQCYSYDKDEFTMKEDCGGASNQKETFTEFILMSTSISLFLQFYC